MASTTRKGRGWRAGVRDQRHTCIVCGHRATRRGVRPIVVGEDRLAEWEVAGRPAYPGLCNGPHKT